MRGDYIQPLTPIYTCTYEAQSAKIHLNPVAGDHKHNRNTSNIYRSVRLRLQKSNGFIILESQSSGAEGMLSARSPSHGSDIRTMDVPVYTKTMPSSELVPSSTGISNRDSSTYRGYRGCGNRKMRWHRTESAWTTLRQPGREGQEIHTHRIPQ